MAKKKQRKEDKKSSNNFKIEVIGILLVLASIIGFVPYNGFVGNLIKAFAIFLFGAWYWIFLVSIFAIGGYMIVKRESVKFFSVKLIGFYMIVLSVLVFAHSTYIENQFDGETNLVANLNEMEVIKETVNNFMASINEIKEPQGGGIIGASVSVLFFNLFGTQAIWIVVITIALGGFVLFTGFSIIDFLKNASNKAKEKMLQNKEKRDKKEIAKAEEKFENDNKIVVSSVDELIHINDEKTEDKLDKSDNGENKISEKSSPIEEEISNVVINDDIYEDNKGYIFPSLNLLAKPSRSKTSENQESIKHNVPILIQVLKDFGIEGKIIAANIGPSVTQYELEIKAGTKVSKLLGIHREIALALAAKEVRIQAPIPGKSTIGIEIPNKSISMVVVREILERVPKSLDDSKLLVTLGKSIDNNPVWCEINKTPHLLVAGSTGSGKSVCINSIIISILMRAKPDEVKLVLVDPKKVELSMYNGVPHLLAPVVTDPKKANIALKKIVVEMERRYDAFSESGTKNIAGYNTYIEKKNETLPEGEKLRKIPYIVVIIDELADLMLVAAKEVEDSIMRITQMARAAGIHLIVATQRPSTDVITGVVKANIPSRISFAVSSSIDSRTILDMTGAEKLLGKGDMLFLPQGENTPIRVQGTYISEDEINAVVDHVIKQQKAHYDETLLMDEEEMHATTNVENSDDADEPLYNEIVEFVVTQGKASASLLQRRFRLGYNRAARVIDLLEERGIIGPNNGSKPREVLVKLDNSDNE